MRTSNDEADAAAAQRRMRPSRNNRVAIALGCTALALILIGIGIGIIDRLTKEQGALARDPNVQVGSVAGGDAGLEATADESMVSFSINTDPVFPDGEQPGNLTIENPEENNNRFTVTIRLKGQDGRVVYRSGAIDPGYSIAQAPLSEDLPAGDYPAIAMIETYRLSDDSPIGQVAAELVLHVEG